MMLYLVLTGVVYIALILLAMFKKELFSNKLLSYILKAVFYIPFWATFLFYSVKLTAPVTYNYFKPSESTQEFKIICDDSASSKFIVLGRKYGSNDWICAYNILGYLPKGCFVSMKTGESKELKYRAGSGDFDYIQIRRVMEIRASKDSNYAKIFKIPNLPILLRSSDFNKSDKVEIIKPIFYDDLNILLVSFFAIIGIIYHIIKLKGKISKKFIAYLIALGVLAIAAHYAFYVGSLFFYYLF